MFYHKNMRVLLINPNRFVSPPVPPLGLEHVAAAIDRAGHASEILDLCFSGDPLSSVDTVIGSFNPDLVGVSVRNIDTVLYQSNVFFLDEVREVIRHIRAKYGLKVLIGGSGIATNPDAVLKYLEADYAVEGPADDLIIRVLDDISSSANLSGVYRRKYRYEIDCPRAFGGGIDYARYLSHGGIAGFQTHKGCGSSCIFCIEADTPVSFRRIENVIKEISTFVDRGIKRFHLCDSEFNEDLDYSIAFCDALVRSGLGIDWALYMKPANYNKRLFALMKASGVSLITLSVDTWKKCPLYWSDIERIIFMAKASGIKIVVDLLAGFPYEDEATLVMYLDMFRRLQPDSVGVNTYIRLYKSLKITGIVMQDEALKNNLLGAVDDASLVRPVFYSHIKPERLEELIGGDPLFRIEGKGHGVNYSRAL